MTVRKVRILPRAEADLDFIFSWVAQQSPKGAAALLDAFENSLGGLRKWPEAFSIAPESELLQKELRQAFFRTRRGNTYRMIFLIAEDVVFILRVRGPGQPPLTPDELSVSLP